MKQAFDHGAARRSILAVGPDGGRGFVVDVDDNLLVVTAAHCLPRLPVPGVPDMRELTFFELLGPLGGRPIVAAECKFVDPVSDLAVLGAPDNQALSDSFRDYENSSCVGHTVADRGRRGKARRGVAGMAPVARWCLVQVQSEPLWLRAVRVRGEPRDRGGGHVGFTHSSRRWDGNRSCIVIQRQRR